MLQSSSSAGNHIDIIGLRKYFPVRAGLFKRQVGSVKAVDDVSFYIKKGETLGLVGESGCGKTTVGRAMIMLTEPTGGYVFYDAPRKTVERFKELDQLIDLCRRKEANEEQLVRMIVLAAELVGDPACHIHGEKSMSTCEHARDLRRELLERKADPKLDRRLTGRLLNTCERALDEVAERYCVNRMKKGTVRRMRGKMQFVFQDPFSSLDPRMLIKDIIAEPLKNQMKSIKPNLKTRPGEDGTKGASAGRSGARKSEIVRERVLELLEKVGLNVEHMYRFPHEFSGGQRQRIGIARALSVNPDLVVLDEPTSALDVSVQAQILNMLNELQEDFGLTYLFISHDLSTIRYMCDRVAVMYLGKIVESAHKRDLFAKPTHPYTEALLSVIPVPDPDMRRDRIILTGDVPSPANPPPGCRFHTRCPLAIEVCKVEEPPLVDRGNEHFVACHVR